MLPVTCQPEPRVAGRNPRLLLGPPTPTPGAAAGEQRPPGVPEHCRECPAQGRALGKSCFLAPSLGPEQGLGRLGPGPAWSGRGSPSLGHTGASPSQTRCVRFSRPSILSMMLLSSRSFLRLSNCQRLSMRRMSAVARGPSAGSAPEGASPAHGTQGAPRVPGPAALPQHAGALGTWAVP